MSRWHAIPAALIAVAAPTQAQLKRAVRAAERSSDLWATVNLCNTRRHPHELGLRGQMPGLGFRTGLYMTFQVYYRSGTRFRPDPGIWQRVYLGRRSGSSVHQAGVTFTLSRPAALEGKITFTWKRGGKAIGQVARMTTGHHKHVDFGDPRGHSAATCRIR